MIPNTTPPSGRVTKPTPYVISDSSTPVLGANEGKKILSKTSAAPVAKAKKSYHSITVPIELDSSSRRAARSSKGAGAGDDVAGEGCTGRGYTQSAFGK